MKESTKYEINAAASLVITAAIIIVCVMICHQHNAKWDLTKNRENTLSPQSCELVKNLNKKVTATVFTDDSAKRKRIDSLLSLYKAQGKNFDYRFYEPNKNPKKASEYGVTADPCIYLETDGSKRERISEATEEKITNSMARLLVTKGKTIYLLAGHGELSADDPGSIKSLALLKDSLEKEIYTVKTLVLKETGEIPDDAAIIAVIGPRAKMFPKEVKLLEDYMAKGGKTLWLTGSDFPEENRGIFDKYGFSMLKGHIVDKTATMLGADPSITIILTAANSEITKGFESLKNMYVMPLCGAFRFEKSVEGTTVIPVLSTSADCSLSVKDPKDDAKDGVYAAGLTIERPIKGSEETEKAVVLGSSLMAAKEVVGQGENLNLLLNSAAWLAEEKNLIAIRPKDEATEPLEMTRAESSQFFFNTVIAMPFFILAVWFSLKAAKKLTKAAGLRK